MPLPIPESLTNKPNIPWEKQTIEQLTAERNYWAARVLTAPGFASAHVAEEFRQGCQSWIDRRLRDGKCN
jgi:hypothetical protein